MIEYALMPAAAWAVTVAATFVVTGSWVTTVGVAFLSGVTAFVAFITGRGVGRTEVETEQREARRARRRDRNDA